MGELRRDYTGLFGQFLELQDSCGSFDNWHRFSVSGLRFRRHMSKKHREELF